MGKISDIDAFILAGAALLIFMLSVISKVLGSRKKKKEPKQSEPPKPDAVVKAAHEAVDTKAEEEQREIEEALKESDPGKAIAELINRRKR
tara:strand:+ start:1891 stop:2163 length:273 start_codon:yes stop_codon:yes gene_type:complete